MDKEKLKYIKIRENLYLCRCGVLYFSEKKVKECNYRNRLFDNRDKDGEPFNTVNLEKIKEGIKSSKQNKKI